MRHVALLDKFEMQRHKMIIFGLVVAALFLFFLVFLPAHSARELLIDLCLSVPYTFVFLQMIYDKYDPSRGSDTSQPQPIFWGKLSAFQNMGRRAKLGLVLAGLLLPLLAIHLLGQ